VPAADHASWDDGSDRLHFDLRGRLDVRFGKEEDLNLIVLQRLQENNPGTNQDSQLRSFAPVKELAGKLT